MTSMRSESFKTSCTFSQLDRTFLSTSAKSTSDILLMHWLAQRETLQNSTGSQHLEFSVLTTVMRSDPRKILLSRSRQELGEGRWMRGGSTPAMTVSQKDKGRARQSEHRRSDMTLFMCRRAAAIPKSITRTETQTFSEKEEVSHSSESEYVQKRK